MVEIDDLEPDVEIEVEADEAEVAKADETDEEPENNALGEGIAREEDGMCEKKWSDGVGSRLSRVGVGVTEGDGEPEFPDGVEVAVSGDAGVDDTVMGVVRSDGMVK